MTMFNLNTVMITPRVSLRDSPPHHILNISSLKSLPLCVLTHNEMNPFNVKLSTPVINRFLPFTVYYEVNFAYQVLFQMILLKITIIVNHFPHLLSTFILV